MKKLFLYLAVAVALTILATRVMTAMFPPRYPCEFYERTPLNDIPVRCSDSYCGPHGDYLIPSYDVPYGKA